jgi:hypothetical protein
MNISYCFLASKGVVAAGGSDAISSMMGPGVQAQQQNHLMMNQGMQGGNVMPGISHQMQQQGVMMYGNPMGGMQGGMNNTTQMGGMQGGMNNMQQMGMQGGMNMNPGMGMQSGMNVNQGVGMQGQGMGMQGGIGGHHQWR